MTNISNPENDTNQPELNQANDTNQPELNQANDTNQPEQAALKKGVAAPLNKVHWKKLVRKTIITTLVLVLLFVFGWYENNHLVVSKYEYSSVRVPESFDGFRIVQISDFHNATFGRDNQKLIDKVDELQPDIIVITGDMVDSIRTDVEISVELAEALSKIAPIYYVTGNHEFRLSEEELSQLVRGLLYAGVRTMANVSEEITLGEDSICIIGLDDGYLQGNTLKKIIDDNANGKLTVVLAHEPQYLDNYAKCGADIVFSGHAHGGQFRIPFIGGLVAPDQWFFPKLSEGCHVKENTTMYISRGLGNSIIPVRINNDPEIVCVDLKHKE